MSADPRPGAGDHAGVAQGVLSSWAMPATRWPRPRAASALFGLHQLVHRLAQFGGALGNQFFQMFPVTVQFRFSACAR
ncbi:MAG: hypothetical protein U1F70_10840 [Candidatus Competibacteraceae bacterium]